jgi:hypothetical protein
MQSSQLFPVTYRQDHAEHPKFHINKKMTDIYHFHFKFKQNLTNTMLTNFFQALVYLQSNIDFRYTYANNLLRALGEQNIPVSSSYDIEKDLITPAVLDMFKPPFRAHQDYAGTIYQECDVPVGFFKPVNAIAPITIAENHYSIAARVLLIAPVAAAVVFVLARLFKNKPKPQREDRMGYRM